ncbi:hypothetical protein FOA43_000906 [Brettanomyces nanus]|uniref:Large ribosomal subunit protein mL53 n=1 Tax=Eeniella nana TaxID=13502 RepID=A0A875S2M4_EENNA|nr:uncharacterized protein FOA43_000906 [Brettanomyces nanus]QPG73594.1 hypothetical protein FOA43_000906 [Brettanomyces nanus]
MITKYFTNVVVKFNPFGPEARAARSVLSEIPPKLRTQCKVDLEVLTKNSTNNPLVEVTFKDKTIMKGNPAQMTMEDFAHMFDRHSRQLQFKDDVSE